MISTDCHCNEPSGLWAERMDEKYRKRLPHIETDENGVKWMVSEGWQKSRAPDFDVQVRGRGSGAQQGRLRYPSSASRIIARDGIDAEIIFPNKGLLMWATQDAEFGAAQCKVYNDWAWETFGQYNSFMSPMAAIMTSDVNLAIAEIERVAKLGFRGLTLPCKPIFGNYDARHPNYNLHIYDPMWAAIQDRDLPITFHISTGRDPRAARKDGGAVINYVSHSLSPTIEPIANLCASGVIEHYPKMRFAAIECGIGWVPWALDAMDEAYRKHHMWAFPKLPKLPSEYFRSNGATTFQEDRVGLDLAVKYNLVDNFMWANDYPHHEGVMAAFGGIDRASDGPSDGGTAREDPRPQCGADLQVRRRRIDAPARQRHQLIARTITQT